jgi:hypothetical protein
VTFDPTPLSDGTSYEPPYASDTGISGPEDDPTDTEESTAGSTAPTAPTDTPQDEETEAAGAGVGGNNEESTATWLWVAIGAIALAAVALTVAGVAAGRSRRRGRLLPFAILSWALLVAFCAAIVSWWLAALVVVLLMAVAPGLIRERRRLSHRHEVHANGATAASSAWSELIAESRDRGIEVQATETVRAAARRMAREHSLDDGGKRALRTVVSEVERSWYGGHDQPNPDLAPAFDDLMAGMKRSNPLGLRAKVLPKSVLRRR